MSWMLEWASAYLALGWAPTPVAPGQKNPVLKDWNHTTLSEADLRTHFGVGGVNVGVRLGEPSGGLVDIDLDAPQAVRLARYFLPRTDAVFGRPGKPASHWLYVCHPLPHTEKFKAPTGAMLVEVRSTGAQTVFPPSVHPSGERVRWEREEGGGRREEAQTSRPQPSSFIPHPSRVSGAELLRAVRQLAAAALLAQHWPARGSRNDAALALAGGLARLGWEPDAVTLFVFAVAEAAGDEESSQRGRAAQATAEKFVRGEAVTGWGSLELLMGEPVVRQAREWAQARGPWKAHPSNVTTFGGTWPSSEGRMKDDDPPPPSSVIPAPSSLIPVSEVAEAPLRWLWPGYLPLGKLVVLDGDPGLGKSTLTLDLAARVSRGLVMPDGRRGDLGTEAGGVLLLSAEDGVADTIRPRLSAAGGDLRRVHVMAGYLPFSLDSHIETLQAWMAGVGARLVIIDPLMAFLGPTVNPYRDADVRQTLAPLAAAADAQGATVLIVRHLNKTLLGPALYRGGGSIGIIGAARAGLLVAADPQDKSGQQRVLAVTKNNLAAPAPSLAYHMEPVGTTVRVVWDGPSDHRAATLLNGGESRHATPALDEAVAFLLETLGEGSRPVSEVEALAARRGIKDKTLHRARKVLGLRPVKDGFTAQWRLALPEGGQVPPKVVTVEG